MKANEERALVSKLFEKTTYYFKVQPVSEAGVGPKSRVSEPIRTKMVIPSKPGRPTASNITHNSLELEWTKPEQGARNIISYSILYSRASGHWKEQQSTKEHALISQLLEKTVYRFKVRPNCEIDHDSESDVSGPIMTKMIIPSEPGKPKAIITTCSSIEINWTKPEQGAHNITSYTVFYWSSIDPPNLWMERKTTDEGMLVSSLLDNETYFFKIQPKCEDICGLVSEISEPIKTKMLWPSKPGKPKATSVTHNSIKLEWSKPDEGAHNVSSYTVFYHSSKQRSKQCVKITNITSERFLVRKLSEKTTYSFKVQPVCEAGVGPKSVVSEPIKTKEIIPSKPGTPEAMDITHNSIKLKWTKPERGAHNVISYVILYQSTKHPTDNWMEQETTELIENVLHLSEKTSYCFKLRPKCENNYGFESNISEPITTKIEAPSKPGKPRALNATDNSIEIEWSKPERGSHNVLSYNIYYHSSKQLPNRCLKVKANEERALVSRLFEKTTYYFKVQPVSEAGVGPKSRVSEPIHTKLIIPSKPGRPEAKDITHDTIKLIWSKPECGAHNINSYTVFYRSANDQWKQQEVVEENTLLTNLFDLTTYYVKIQPNCETGRGSESDQSKPIKTKIMIPSKPGKPTPLEITYRSVELEWSKPEKGVHSVTSYIVFYANSKFSDDWTKLPEVVTTEKALVSRLFEKTSYYFKIQPECVMGCGPESDISELITTKMIFPSKPGKPTAKSITHDSIDLEWSAPKDGACNVVHYTICYYSSSDPNRELKHVSKGSIPSAHVSQLLQNTTYFFKIQPEPKADCSSVSDISDPITAKRIVFCKSGKPRASLVTHDSIELVWTKPEQINNDNIAYNISYNSSCQPPTKWEEYATNSTEERVLVSNLYEKTTYVFKIQVIYGNSIGLESISSPITTSVTVPGQPGIPEAVSITENSIQLKWTEPEQGAHNVTHYTVLYCVVGDPCEKWTMETTNTAEAAFCLSSLQDHTLYCIKVRSEYEGGNGIESGVSEPIKTKLVRPSKPTKLLASMINTTTIQLKPKQDAYNITSYTILYCCKNDSPDQWTEVGKSQACIMTINRNKLKSGTNFLFKVRPELQDGSGPESDLSNIIETKQSLAHRVKESSRLIEDFYSTQKKEIKPFIRKGNNQTQKITFNISSLVTQTRRHPEVKKFQLPIKESVYSKASHVQQYLIDIEGTVMHKESDERVLLIVGHWHIVDIVNAIANYIFGVHWQDDFWFEIFRYCVSQITICTFYPMEGSQISFTLNLIVVPAFYGARTDCYNDEINTNKAILNDLKDLFLVESKNGIKKIHGIVLVIGYEFNDYIFDSLLTLFGKDIVSNIFLISTEQSLPHLRSAEDIINLESNCFIVLTDSIHSMEKNNVLQKFFTTLGTTEPKNLAEIRKNLIKCELLLRSAQCHPFLTSELCFMSKVNMAEPDVCKQDLSLPEDTAPGTSSIGTVMNIEPAAGGAHEVKY